MVRSLAALLFGACLPILIAAGQYPLIINTAPEFITRDVAIIGGGASGTYAASRLREKGFSVTLVEKLDRLGGHSQTYTDPVSQKAIEYGVVFFHDNKLTRDFMTRHGIEPYSNTITDPSLHRIEFYDLQTGEHTDFQPPEMHRVQAALQKYSDLLAANFSYLEFGYDLPNPVPEELLMPFLDFVRNYELEDMLNLAFQMGQGYGDFLHEPTLYAMKIVSGEILQHVGRGSLLRTKNNSELYGSVERELRDAGDLFLGSRVIETDRNPDKDGYTSLLVEDKNGLPTTIRARQLLLTVPPTIDILTGFFTLTEREVAIFSQFKSNWYWAGVLRNARLPDFEVQNVDLSNPGGVPTLPGMYVFEATDAPDIHTFWYGADARTGNQTEERIRNDVLETIKRIRSANGDATSDLEEVEFLALGNFSPFACMVETEAIRHGFYRELYGLQGQNNTWWTGAAWHTHDSSKLWQFTELILERVEERLRDVTAFSPNGEL